MKYLLLVLTCLPALAFCQDIPVKSVDQFTNDATYSMQPESYLDSVNHKGIAWVFKKTKRHTTLFIGGVADRSLGCIDMESPIEILFTDGSKEIVRNYHDFSCTDDFFNAVLSKKELKSLCEKRIKALRFYYFKQYFDIDIPQKISDKINGQANAINAVSFKN